MRIRLFAIVLLAAMPALGQGTPPPAEPTPANDRATCHEAAGTPPDPVLPQPKLRRVKTMVKKEVNKAIALSDPSVQDWRPLTTRQKSEVFLKYTRSPRTFAGAAVNAAADKWQNDNMQYARGFPGYAQHYAVELATGETNVFFGSLLIPVLLRQDPRYFRNPGLPFPKRALYSLTRVLITRTDSGHQTFNASYVLGGVASQALSDLYVPGQRQGMHPIADRLTFNLARDAGFNLLHEFWPDLRRIIFHR